MIREKFEKACLVEAEICAKNGEMFKPALFAARWMAGLIIAQLETPVFPERNSQCGLKEKTIRTAVNEIRQIAKELG